MNRSSLAALPVAVLLALAPAAPAQGQILNRIKNAARRGAEQAAEREAERRADEAVTRAAARTEAAVSGERGAPGHAEGENTPDAAPIAEPTGSDERALVNYDFVPGETVLFAEDLENEVVGDFPTRLAFVSGTYETAEWKGRRWLRATAFGAFGLDLPSVLPDRFTFEFEVAVPPGWVQQLQFADGARNGLRLSPDDGGVEALEEGAAESVAAPVSVPEPMGVFPVKVMADRGYVKVYLNGTRVANIPNADLGRSHRITFQVKASQEYPAYFGAFRVAEGGRTPRAVQDAVTAAAPGSTVVLTGVEFDTGSARLRPESGPTLDAVAASLRSQPSVRVRIEGHTDNTGTPAGNEALSLARAEAVVAALGARGVALERMEAEGRGATHPVADNDTPEGRQQNRRVVVVRQPS